MYRFELVIHQPKYEEYLILLPPGSPREITKPLIVSIGGERMQEVGIFILSRCSSNPSLERDRITVIAHPGLQQEERVLLLKEIEGICGKHVYGYGAEFEPMLVLSEELCPWTPSPVSTRPATTTRKKARRPKGSEG